MNWTTLIGPAVVAAAIAAVVSIIVAVINRATLRAMHRERLDLDRDLADRKATADIALAERKSPLTVRLRLGNAARNLLSSCSPISIKPNASLKRPDHRES
jgi:hypothetical protein